MAHELDIYEVLSAYLIGDVSVDERNLVERRLADDAVFRFQAKELREFIQLLNKGVRPLREELLTKLRERIQQQIAQAESELQVQALLSASLSNDLDAQEKIIFERHMARKPEAQRELQTLRVLSSNLNRGKLPVSENLSRKLAERLNAKLPPAARIQPPAEVSIVKAPGATPSQPAMDTVRVYGERKSDWSAGFGWIAVAAAASIALIVGVGRMIAPPAGNSIANTTVIVPEPPRETPERITTGGGHGPLPLPERAPIAPPQPKFVDAPNKNNVEKIDTPIPEVVKNDTLNPVPSDLKLPVEKIVTAPLAPIPGTKGVDPKAPKTNPEVANVPPAPNTFPQPNLNKVDPQVPNRIVDNRTNSTSVGIVGAGGTVVAPVPNASVAIAAKDPVPAPVPVPESAVGAVVTAIRDGRAQFRPTVKGEPQSLAANDTILSGSQINSDSSRIGLKLPDDSKLYINSNSEVIVTFKGNNTEVTLNAGEVSFSGGRGTVTVNGPLLTSTKVKDAKSVNVKIEENMLVVSNLHTSPASVSNKAKTVSLGAAPAKATIALDSSKAPQMGTYPPNVSPQFWTDGIERIVASDTPAPTKSNGKGRAQTTSAIRRTR